MGGPARFVPPGERAGRSAAGAVLGATARVHGVYLARLSELALGAPARADGLVPLSLLRGGRTPNLPEATGSLHGTTLANLACAHLARAASRRKALLTDFAI